jgi:hypothetical protein
MDEEAKNVASKPAVPGSNPGGRTTPEVNFASNRHFKQACKK